MTSARGASVRIGIVLNYDTDRSIYWSAPAYSSAIAKAGGLPLLIPHVSPADRMLEILEIVDGLVLSGGDDFHPRHYGVEDHPSVRLANPERDELDLTLARAALDRDMPVLGICRGAQCLNVAAGGTLVPDLPSVLETGAEHVGALVDLVHDVDVEPDSKLAAILGSSRLRVNSDHHQAVAEVAPGFVVAARATDGVIEAIEAREHRWVIGVQWHPERIAETTATDAALIAAFVAAARDAQLAVPGG